MQCRDFSPTWPAQSERDVEKMVENRDEAANGQVYGDESDSCVQHRATYENDSRGKREKLVTLVTTATTATVATIVVFG